MKSEILESIRCIIDNQKRDPFSTFVPLGVVNENGSFAQIDGNLIPWEEYWKTYNEEFEKLDIFNRKCYELSDEEIQKLNEKCRLSCINGDCETVKITVRQLSILLNKIGNMNTVKIELGTRGLGDGFIAECLDKKEWYPTLVISNYNNTQYCRFLVSYDNLKNMIQSLENQVNSANEAGYKVK
jgi:hypothetical protein